MPLTLMSSSAFPESPLAGQSRAQAIFIEVCPSMISMIFTMKYQICKESSVIDETLTVSPFYGDDAKNFIHHIHL